MKSGVNKNFWKMFDRLPQKVRDVAKETYRLFEENPYHEKLEFKSLIRNRNIWTVRVGIRYRAVGRMVKKGEIVWFWIGSHEEYNKYAKGPNKLGQYHEKISN